MSDSLLDDLLNDSQTNYLKKTCPSLFDDSGTPSLSYNNILSTEQTQIIPDGLKYYQVVETGNNYVDDLLNEEEKYLKEKYGESLYNHFVTKREEYIGKKMRGVCSTLVSCGSSGDTSTNGLTVALRKQLGSYKHSLKVYNEVSKKKEKKTEGEFLNARKFQYRTHAMEDTNLVDMAMSVVYYFILGSSIIYLTIKGRIEMKKKWWIYTLLFLLPLGLPIIYRFGVRQFHKMEQAVSEQGPKKAFMNQK